MHKLPAFQFYPADWRKDPSVQALSFFDRGVWFEILCLMHESEQRGKLLLNGKPMPDEALARLLGLDKQILTKTISVLLDYGVASRDEQGALINRRMVRDENLRQIRIESGKKGGNPNLVNQNSTKTKNQVNQNSTPSSSSSSSTSNTKEKTTEAVVKKKAATASTNKNYTDDDFLDALTANLAYKHLSIRIEFEKAKIWCENNNRELTRKFFINWINRIPQPMQANGVTNGSIQNGNSRNGQPTTERERRELEARQRIKFDELTDEFLESEGIVQVGGS